MTRRPDPLPPAGRPATAGPGAAGPLPFALRRAGAAAALTATLALPAAGAEPPRVATDVAPVHAIVAAVMAGIGAPHLLVPPGASEHSYALRPSDAAALDAADLVVWVGPELTPWLAAPLATLAGDASLLTLTKAPGLRLAPARAGGAFEAHAHGGRDEDAGHDDEPDGDGRAEAGHGAVDPHVWLDPDNAAAIAAAAAEALAAADPAHAETYRANAAAFAAETAALSAEVEARVAPLRGRPYVVFHDAYRYFEDRFGLPATGAIAATDAEAPSPARLAEIRALVEGAGAACVFAEPQFDPKLVATIVEGTKARPGTLDAVGFGLEPGPGLYPALIARMAEGLAACLGAP